jgi:hypothetical protein
MRSVLRLLAYFCGFLIAIQLAAQSPITIPVTGNLSQLSGSPQPYGGLSIQLQNCASPVAITGYSAIVQQSLQLRANASGFINATIWPNDEINCNGTTGNSMYAVVPIVNGVPSGTPQCYQVTSTQGTWNLNTQQPIACTQTPPDPQDATYNNLDVNGCLSIQGGDCITGGGGGGGGGMVYPPAGIPQSTGTAWGQSKPVQGGDTALLSVGIITPGAGTPLCLDGADGATTSGCPVPTVGLTPAVVYPGFVYQTSATATRKATFEDAISSTLLGYAPLRPDGNLFELTNKVDALENLFLAAGASGPTLMGTNNSTVPVPVSIGSGLTYTPATGTGSVIGLTITGGGSYSSGCAGLTFTGGGGSGAAAYATCAGTPGNFHIASTTITNGGSGYTSPPTVVVSGSGGGSVVAAISNTGTIAIASAQVVTSIRATTFYTAAEFSNGTCTTALTVTPVNGNRQRVTLTDANVCALTFTQPVTGTGVVQLKVTQSAAGAFSGGISGCKWPGGVVPTITQTSGAVDILSAYLDGTTAYCQIGQAFN